MDVTAVPEPVKRKLTNSRPKRSVSSTQLTEHCPSKRRTNLHVRDYFLQHRSFADVKIEINGEIIWCDKGLLAAASPVLCERLCQLNSQENLLKFDDIDPEEFFLFLQFIYPIFNPEINQHTISALLKLAHRFQFGRTTNKSNIAIPSLSSFLSRRT